MISPPEAEEYLGRQAFAIWWRQTHPTGVNGWLSLADVEWQRLSRQIERSEVER